MLRRVVAGIVLALAITACGSAASTLTAVAADSGLVPKDNGFSFANFPATATPEQFNSDDLVTMFGPSACTGGTTSPCNLTQQAAAWARMVNEARSSGHCEGLAVQSAARFQTKATPATVTLTNTGDVTHGIMRAFATQFLPEVQKQTNAWDHKSLVDIVNALSEAFKAGTTPYTMGLYTPTGGHAVLPYALQFPSKTLAVIKVYDSNWPGMERYVVIDLKAKDWYFSFSGSNPQKDDCAWTGKAGDIDLTPMDARTSATCPFCGDKAQVTKNVLLIRSTSLNWSITTKQGTFTPKAPTDKAGVDSHAIRTGTCSKEVRIPEFVLSTDTTDFQLSLPDTSSAYVSTGKAVVHISTNGSKNRKPVVFHQNAIQVSDSDTKVDVAAGNLAANVSADLANITIDPTQISIDASVGNSTQNIVVNDAQPQVVVDTSGGSVQTTTNVSLNSVAPTVVTELVPDPVKPGLTPVDQRDLANIAYATEVKDMPITPVTAPPMTTTTTTSTTTTTIKASKNSTTTTSVQAVVNNGGGSQSADGTTTTTAVSVNTTSTTVHASTSTSTSTSTTTTVAPTTTTAPVQMVTLKIIVRGTGWTPGLQFAATTYSWDQRYDEYSCSSIATCNNKTVSIPLDSYLQMRASTDQGQSYVSFGAGSGGSSLSGTVTYPSSDSRRCGANYAGWANNTCEFYMFKDFNTYLQG
jgi:hypothetical protein